MGPELKINALKHIMRNFMEKFDSIESTARPLAGKEKFDYVLSEIREFAVRKRLDEQFLKAKGDPMQIGEVKNEEQEVELTESQEQLDTTGDTWTDWCIAAMNVGKGYGKGQFTGTCFKCGKPGHKAVNCQNPQSRPNTSPGKGGAQTNAPRACFTCGQTNHMQKDCPIYRKGKGKGKKNWNTYQNKGYGKGNKGWGKGIHEMTQFLGAMSQMNPWYQGQWEPESPPDPNTVTNLGNEIGSITRECKPSVNTTPSNEWSVCVKKSRSNKDMRPMKESKKKIELKPIEPLTRDDANEVLHVEQQGEWERLRVVVDSGACETVGPANVATGFELRPTNASINNVHYVAANGTRIRNHGQRTIRGMNGSGNQIGFAMQAADVNKVLAAVNQIVEAGNRVTFDSGPRGNSMNSHIYNYATGARTDLELVNCQYVFDMWIPNMPGESRAASEVAVAAPTADTESTPVQPVSGFQGQETPQ